MADSQLFVDTNILVFANVAEAPKHDMALHALKQSYSDKREMWISRQILREFLAVRTRVQTFAKAADIKTIIERIRWFESHFRVAEDNAAVTRKLIEIMENHQVGGKQVHDANIVATMLVNGIDNLLTDNFDDFKRYEDLINIESIETKKPTLEENESTEN